MASGSRPHRMILGIRFPDSSSRAPGSRRSSQPLCPSLAQSLQVLLHLRMAYLSPPFQFGFVVHLPATCTKSSSPTGADSPCTPPVASWPGPKGGRWRRQSGKRLRGGGALRLYRRALHPGIAHHGFTCPRPGQAHHAVAFALASEGSLTARPHSIKSRHIHHLLPLPQYCQQRCQTTQLLASRL